MLRRNAQFRLICNGLRDIHDFISIFFEMIGRDICREENVCCYQFGVDWGGGMRGG